MQKENQILLELLNGVDNWSDLKPKLEQFNTSQTETTTKKTLAGKVFEVFAKYYFQTEPKKTELYENVWFYDDVPLEIKQQLRLPSVDHGIDILLQDYEKRFYAVQCKFKNDETKSLSWSGDKIANVFALGTNCDKVIVFTNVSDITQVAKSFEQKFELIAFDELISIEEDIFENIFLLAKGNQPKELEKYSPQPHQEIAITKVLEHFRTNERGQLILPCGAGKSLTSLWIKEDINPETTLVLVPSLALLKQIKNNWSRHKNDHFKYLCVCSEKDIDKDQQDAVNVHTYEIGGPVTTDPLDVKAFLMKSGNKVIYSTYQSIGVISDACRLVDEFQIDLVICDEAHRTAGSKNKNTFTLVHDNANIPALKRLYMTATPKVVSTKLKTRLGEDYELLCDMSNPDVYGLEAFRMSFGQAIDEGILVDYKIIGIGVTDKQIKKFIEERNFIGEISIDELAHNFALDLVMNKYKAFHAISFHSKVKFAQDFAIRHKQFFETIFSESVNGKQTTTYRARVLRDFKNSEIGLVTNARCLTEGVDVPTIDLIYFCDPKTSKIDIVQASGRALRTNKAKNKELGFIVVPIFHHIDEDVEKEIKKKPIFDHLIQVIRSLCDQDERLQAEINDIAFKKGKKSNSKIQIDFSDDETEKIVKLEGLEKKV
ncbi:MAG: DEAD/DEAH box helicase family protein, partial [Algoriphagus sp.]